MAAVRDKGVNFANPHSRFLTFTMANPSGLSTGNIFWRAERAKPGENGLYRPGQNAAHRTPLP